MLQKTFPSQGPPSPRAGQAEQGKGATSWLASERDQGTLKGHSTLCMHWYIIASLSLIPGQGQQWLQIYWKSQSFGLGGKTGLLSIRRALDSNSVVIISGLLHSLWLFYRETQSLFEKDRIYIFAIQKQLIKKGVHSLFFKTILTIFKNVKHVCFLSI